MIHAHDGGNPQVPFYDKPSFVFLLNASLSDFFKKSNWPLRHTSLNLLRQEVNVFQSRAIGRLNSVIIWINRDLFLDLPLKWLIQNL